MNDFQISWCRFVSQKVDHSACKEHRHSIFELHILLSGTASIFFTDGTSTTIYQGQYILLPAHTQHWFEFDSEQDTRLVIGFSSNSRSMQKQLQGLTEYFYCHSCPPVLSLLVEALNQKKDHSFPLKQNYSLLLSHCIIYECISPFLPQTSVYLSSPDACSNPYLEHANHFIDENISLPFSVDDLSKAIGISSQYLNRIFQKEYGVSTLTYIQKKKVTHAQQLLTSTKLSVEDIAESMGYSSVYSFSRFFKSVTNISPAKYRREHTD